MTDQPVARTPGANRSGAKTTVLSVVVPMRNEAGNIDAVFGRLIAVLERIAPAHEIICIDDGSTDATWARLLGWRARHPQIRLMSLSRNFGKEVALTAGLDAVRGDAVVMIDADLQHPPELIEEFLVQWRAGNDMVYAQRRDRKDEGFIRRNAARAFYWAFGRVADVDMPRGAGDFRLLDRKVVDALRSMPERARFMKGMYAWVGFRHTGVMFDPDPRHDGRSAFRLGSLLRFAADGMVSFSTAPLTACAYLGALFAVPSVLIGMYFLFRTLILGADIPGYASIIVSVMVLGGVQLLTLGLFGAYLGRLYEEVKHRPLYIVRQSEGFDAEAEHGARPVLPLKGPVHAREAAQRAGDRLHGIYTATDAAD